MCPGLWLALDGGKQLVAESLDESQFFKHLIEDPGGLQRYSHAAHLQYLSSIIYVEALFNCPTGATVL